MVTYHLTVGRLTDLGAGHPLAARRLLPVLLVALVAPAFFVGRAPDDVRPPALAAAWRSVVAPADEPTTVALEVGPDEPLELLQLDGLPDQHVLGDLVEVVEILDQLRGGRR